MSDRGDAARVKQWKRRQARKKRANTSSVSAVTPPDQQDRQRAARQAERVVTPRRTTPPVVAPPDQQDRRRAARRQNVERGAAPTGGPGQAERTQYTEKFNRPHRAADRQRHLLREGYDIKVDDVWGPKSKAAWADYQRRLVKGEQLNVRAKMQFIQKALYASSPDIEAEKRLLGVGAAFQLDQARRRLQANFAKLEGQRASISGFVDEQLRKEADEGFQLTDLTREEWMPGVQRRLEEAGAAIIPDMPDFGGTGEKIAALILAGGDPRKAPSKHQQLQQQQAAGMVPAQMVGALAEGFDRSVQDVYEMTMGAPGGILMATAHPIRAGEAIKADFAYRYGPLFQGDFNTFIERQAEHPVYFGLDIAAALQISVKAGQIARVMPKAPPVRRVRVNEGYVQPFQSPAAATGLALHWFDRFSEKVPDAPLVGSKSRVQRRLAFELDRDLDRARQGAIPLEKAGRKLKGPERMAYDLLARYGDKALPFLDMEINKRMALASRPRVTKKEAIIQRANIRALRASRDALLAPRRELEIAVAAGRHLATETENIRIDFRFLTPRTARERINLSARIFGELPEIEDVESRLRFYSQAMQHLPEGQANAVLAATDAMAYAWAARTGGAPADFYRIAFSHEKARLGFDPHDVDLDNLPDDLRVLYQLADKWDDPQVKSYYDSVAKNLAAHPGKPLTAQSPSRLSRLAGSLRQRAVNAQAYRFWYERSSEAILKHVDGDVQEARKIAQLLAIFSPRSAVWDETTWNNVTRAIGAYDEFKATGQISDKWSLSKVGKKAQMARAWRESMGMEVRPDKRDWQTEDANRAMGDDWHDWYTIKAGTFFWDFLQDTDPAAAKMYAKKHDIPDHRVVIDTWMRRAFGYPVTGAKKNETITPEMFDFMSQMTDAIAKELGWEGRQAQAAIWTSIKAEVEGAPLEAAGFSFADALREYAARPKAIALFQSARGLEGLPEKGSPNGELQELALEYMTDNRVPGIPPRKYVTVDEERATRIANWYEHAKHMPDDPGTAASYDAFTYETLDQYYYLIDAGYKFEFYPEGETPYASPWDAMRDLDENKHLYVFPTESGFGVPETPSTPQQGWSYERYRELNPDIVESALGFEPTGKHPLLKDSGLRWNGRVVTHNDVFRAVHDVFGHKKEGVGFRADGEENAWRQHVAMYSPVARGAMTSETRGQNSWVNYGPHGEKNRTANQEETVYAEQKAVLAPEWVQNEGATDGLVGAELENTVAMERGAVIQGAERLLYDEMRQQEGSDRVVEIIQRARDTLDQIEDPALVEGLREQIEKLILGADIEELAGWLTLHVLSDELVGTRDLQVLRDLRGSLPPIEGITREMHDLPDRPESQIPPEEGGLAADARFAEAAAKELEEHAAMARDVAKTMPGKQWPKWVRNQIRDQAEKWGMSMEEFVAMLRRTTDQEFYQREPKTKLTATETQGRIRGAVEFTKGPGAMYFSSETSDVLLPADISTFIHEPAHILRRFMPEDMLKHVEAELGVTGGKWTRSNEEDFARLVEGYFYRGKEPNPQMREPMLKIRDKLREVYRASPVPMRFKAGDREAVYSILDELFDSTASLKAGDGAFFMPDTTKLGGAGLPGRKRTLTGRRRKEIHPSRGILYQQGRVQRGPQVTVKDFYRTARLQQHRISLEQADRFSVPLDIDQYPDTGGLPPGHVYYNPDGYQIPRVYRETPSQDDLLGMFPSELAMKVRQQYDEVLSSTFPESVVGLPAGMAENVRAIPQQVADAFLGKSVIMATGRKLPGIQVLGRAIDTTNAIAKAALIYGKLAYIPVNFAGNLLFLTIKSGPFAAAALVRASRALGRMNPELLAKIDYEVGEGSLAALTAEEGTNTITRAVRQLAQIQSGIADRLPRRAAYIYVAAKYGFYRERDLVKLLERSNEKWKGDITYKEIANQIGEEAEKAMVQFRGMSPFQKEVISRAIFIYGWMRGAAKYTGRMPLDMPVRADLIAHLGQEEYDDIERFFGKIVSYLDGIKPVGAVERKLGLDTVQVRQLRAINPVSTGGEALMALYNFAKGDPAAVGPQVVDYISPPVKMGIEVTTGYNTFFQEPYESRWDALSSPISRIPLKMTIEMLLDPESFVTSPDVADTQVARQPNYILEDKEAVYREALENLIFGSVRERTLNIGAAQARGAEERGGSTETKYKLSRWAKESEELGLGRPPKFVLDQHRDYIELEKQLQTGMTYKERVLLAAKMYDTRFNTHEGLEEARRVEEDEAEELYHELRGDLFEDFYDWRSDMEEMERERG